jgi:hypothetical protein
MRTRVHRTRYEFGNKIVGRDVSSSASSQRTTQQAQSLRINPRKLSRGLVESVALAKAEASAKADPRLTFLTAVRFEHSDGVAQFGGALVKFLRNGRFHLAFHHFQLRKRPFRTHFLQPFFQERDLGAL